MAGRRSSSKTGAGLTDGSSSGNLSAPSTPQGNGILSPLQGTRITTPLRRSGKGSFSSSTPARRGVGTASKNDGSHNSSGVAFNPRLIFSQILALQCFHYLILGFIIQCNHVFFSTTITIDRIFTDKYLNTGSKSGWVDNSAILLSYVAGSVLLAMIVEKSKKCLDFSVTLFLINLTVCGIYAGVPSKMDWWIVHILGTIIMVVLGEYLCSRRELSDIPLLEI